VSVYFLANEKDLWNPGFLAARFFCDAVASISGMLGIESGLGPILSDEVVVDPVALHAFALQMRELLLNRDPTSATRVMLSGTFAIVVALDVAATEGGGSFLTDPSLVEYVNLGQAAMTADPS
jgi:hypothetical protein